MTHTRADSRQFASDLQTPRIARSWVRDLLLAWNVPALVDDTQLLVSELLTNVVLHVGCAMTLTVELHAGRVRLAVRDDSPVTPRLAGGEGLYATGRGFILIDAVAAAWGVEQDATGKTVWCDLANPARATTATAHG